MPINVISKRRLTDYGTVNPPLRGPLETWHAVVSKAHWANFADVKKTFNRADLAFDHIVFDVNSHRLIVKVDYAHQRVYIKHIFNHNEYMAWTKRMRSA